MTTLTLRDTWRYPFADFDGLFRSLSGDVARQGFRPAADVSRDAEDAVVRVELPGLDLERDVTVEVDRGALVIRGERRDERSEERGGRVLREVRYGSFRRTFKLPAHVTGSDLSASYDAGVLTVRIAGAYRGANAQRIPVTVGAPALDGTDGTDATGTDA
jgi:HSP20 family molecular chaperone IbpA